MGVQERRAREKRELRQEILDAARELFIREGFENISMRKIAEKIEYSPTTIYLYFQDKADLLDCVCEETLQKLETRLASIYEAVADPLARLQQGMHAYIEFGLEHPNDYRVAFLLELKPFTETDHCPRCRAMGQKNFEYLRAGVSDCMRLGAFGQHDIEAASQALWTAIHGVTSLLILHPHFPWVERGTLIDTVIKTALDGLRAPLARTS